MSTYTFAKRWDHSLRIKHIFMGDDIPDLPAASETAEMAEKVAKAVRSLRDRLDDGSQLHSDLDDCLEDFDLTDVDNAYEARDRFNSALQSLYDIADYGKRVWIA